MILDEITIENLEVTCIVGILASERVIKQPLAIDIKLGLDVSNAATLNDLSQTVDYALIAQQVAFILEAGQFELIETAALALVSWLAAPNAAAVNPASWAEVCIRKPKALSGNGIAGIRLRRHQDQIVLDSAKDGSTIIFKSAEVAILRATNGNPVDGGLSLYPIFLDFSTGGMRGRLRVCRRR